MFKYETILYWRAPTTLSLPKFRSFRAAPRMATPR